MALFGLIFFVVAMILLGVGIALGVFVSILAFVLLSLGVISSSVVVGMRRKSAGAGIRMFLILTGLLGGIPSGILCAWIASNFMDMAGVNAKILVYGGLSGAVSGLFLAVMFDFIYRNSSRWIEQRFSPAARVKEVEI